MNNFKYQQHKGIAYARTLSNLQDTKRKISFGESARLVFDLEEIVKDAGLEEEYEKSKVKASYNWAKNYDEMKQTEEKTNLKVAHYSY